MMTPAQILVVEDEAIVALDLQQRLQGLGYRVPAHASSGEEAIQKASEVQSDLVLMDIRLKGDMDGIEAAAQIRTRLHLPVIYLTAHTDEGTLQRAKATEPFGYIRKPFDDLELQIAIEMGLHKHQMEQQRAEVVAMLTHDIKNPLGVLSGCVHLLREEGGLSTQQEDLVRHMERNTQTLLLLMTNYLERSRLEAGYLTLAQDPVQLNELLRQVGYQYEVQARHQRITFALSLQDQLPLVAGDAVALERIFMNLLHNALKFTPAGGQVTVSTRQQDDTVVVAVADTGAGIAPDELPLIFEQFRQVPSALQKEGMGLGLFIVKVLVEAHGGRVAVASTLGQGTCFSVYLPVV